MATLSSYILAVLCISTAILLVYCDDPDVYFETKYQRVSEDVGSVFINISSRGSVERKAYLYFQISSTAIPGLDYEFPTINETSNIYNFTISPGTTRSFELVIIDDSTAEYHIKILYYSLYVYGFTDIDYIGGRYIEIEDNDGAYFTDRSIRNNEDDGNTTFCVNYTSRDDLPQTVNVSVNSRDDYFNDIIFNGDGVSFILNGTSSVCFDVVIIDDEENEDTESFRFYLYFYNGSLTQRLESLRIRIIDNEEAAYVRFENTSYSVLESDGMVNVCLTVDRSDGTEEFEVYLSISNLTTQGVTDHEVEVERRWYGPVTFLVDDVIQCFNINITDDEIEEDIEFFQLSFHHYSIYAVNGNPKIFPMSYYDEIAIITIYDDDLICDPECVNGVCRVPGVCVCDDGWSGEDCSIEICQASCGENGVCNVNTGDCDCSPGYTSVFCDKDVLECVIDNGGCDQICTDFLGGYSCSCWEGYQLMDDEKSCIDIDECMYEDHGCNQTCVNTVGSYYCNCERGFQPVNLYECEDIDECLIFLTCRQVCVNTFGSYHCDCYDGYRLVSGAFCTDINECLEMSDNCSRSKPAPAKCINQEGSFQCSCDEHTGYRLSTNGTTCVDVNECEEGTHLCTDICVNTPGSYNCSCPPGEEIDETVGLSCQDKDECKVMNGGCEHTCTNTNGSYTCSCNRGYMLMGDLDCQAMSCMLMLEAPQNGSINCDTQTVGGMCTFSCDDGFTLRGTEVRVCQSSRLWTGLPVTCDPPMCFELKPPSNGFVSFPCTREEGDTCNITCAHGYKITSPTVQTCMNDINNTLVWSEGPECIERDQCSPNPCHNGGSCVTDGETFSCACNGTGFGGPTCKRPIIYFSPIPPIDSGRSFLVNLSIVAPLNESVKVSVRANKGNLIKYRIRSWFKSKVKKHHNSWTRRHTNCHNICAKQ